MIEACDETVEFVCGGKGDWVKPNILVIDDEESIRFTFERFLTLEGYNVITARDCREARDRINQGTVDLVFADIVLPDGTGMDILCEIRRAQPACPVIMITAYPSAETAQETLRLGASDYITKPVRQQEVIASAKLVLQRNRRGNGNTRDRRGDS